MSLNYIPINPDDNPLTASKSAMERLAGGESATLGNAPELSHAEISINFIDQKIWGELFSVPIDFKGHGEVICFVIDVMLYANEINLLHDGHKMVIQRKGSGFRLGVAAGDAKVKITADIQQIAALVQVNQTSIIVESSIVGVDTTRLDLSKFPLFRLATTDFPSINQHIGTTAANLTDFFAEHPDAMIPRPIGTTIVSSAEYTTDNVIASHNVALEGIVAKRSFKRQIEHMERWWPTETRELLLLPIMRSVYDEFGSRTNDDLPSDENRNIAWHILHKGK